MNGAMTKEDKMPSNSSCMESKENDTRHIETAKGGVWTSSG